MAKMYGVIGYAETTETEAGIWEEQIVERGYYGELNRNFGKHESSSAINDNINIANEVSIIADPYAMEHFFAMRYIKFTLPPVGGAWKITNAEVSYPRILLTIGGVYNGDTTGTAERS